MTTEKNTENLKEAVYDNSGLFMDRHANVKVDLDSILSGETPLEKLQEDKTEKRSANK
jgi:hypothetical protein